MLWSLDNPNAMQIIADYQRFNQPIPKDLEPPPVHDVEAFYLRAFRTLSTDRQQDEHSTGPIPWSSIDRYIKPFKFIDPELFELVIRELDAAFLNHKSGAGKKFTREMLKGR